VRLDSAQLHAPTELDDFNGWALERGWGDGLPLVPPTEGRVTEMVAGAGRPAEELIAIVEPRRGMATVEKIAINAVMAGCRRDYMPVLVAAVEALVDPAVNHEGIQSTTNPGGPMLIVNGPVRDRIGLAYGPDALGPGNRANQTIGRALRLVMRNVGGGVPPADQSIQGSPWKLGMVVAEHEDASPWAPLHVDRGFGAEESVVTVVNSESVINVPAAYPEADDVLSELARALGQGLNVHTSRGVLPLGLNVGHARLLADAGYSKAEVRYELFERAKVPLSALPASGNMPMSVWTLDGNRVLVTRSPEDVLLFVFGGDTPYHSLCFGGWGVGGAASRAVTEL
jgi:hypothetical protein